MFTKPTVEDFRNFFSRDFPYAPYIPDSVDPVNVPPTQDPNAGITDADITRAFFEGEVTMNLELAGDQDTYTMFYLYAAAHFLVMDLRASSGGLEGSFQWTTQSKSVGSVSESYAIPQMIIDNPGLNMWTKTPYGAKLINMMLPYFVANIFPVCGMTQA